MTEMIKFLLHKKLYNTDLYKNQKLLSERSVYSYSMDVNVYHTTR